MKKVTTLLLLLLRHLNIQRSFQYEWASPFKNGKAKVMMNGEEFYIDKSGNKTTAPFEKHEEDNYKMLPPLRTT
jgi:hypothetical protein